MSQERFYVLMRQFIENRIDEQGLVELQALAGSGNFEDTLKRVFDEVYDAPVHQHDLTPDRVRKILYAIHQSASVVEMPAHETTRFRPFRSRAIGWAAALLILAGGYLVYKQTRPSPPAAIARHDLPAGTNKAILTLANGQQVVLDSTAKGQLASQGGIQVLQLDSGQLAYVAGNGKGDGKTTATGSYNTLATPRGGQYRITLPDGTKVWLNSASSLKYPTAFDDRTRNVELNGEAYFEVAKNSKQPFSVTSNGLRVDVLGTDFNVNAYPDEDSIRTTLVSGAVRLLTNETMLDIKPGEQGSTGRKAGRFVVAHPDVQEIVAWKNGEFIFYSQPIQTIMRQVSRWYDVDIEYHGTPPATLFSGDITRFSKASALLDLLELTGDIHFEITDRKIVVLPGSKPR
jgi:ferric-dicitrate binding protein FerR (iron transport regulator)